ncbi:hypothetical protein DN748_13790 [Sinomicrobium soli]|nr:hypothetical protein DN748_13790 [Sinomicrobium sp. N-1-3-6]
MRKAQSSTPNTRIGFISGKDWLWTILIMVEGLIVMAICSKRIQGRLKSSRKDIYLIINNLYIANNNHEQKNKLFLIRVFSVKFTFGNYLKFPQI